MSELEGQKTTGLTVLGAVSVLLGALWFFAGVWGFVHIDALMRMTADAGAPQVLKGFGVTGAYVDASVNMLLAILLFVAGVGLLMLRRWGATLAVFYGVSRIAWSVLAVVLAILGPIMNLPKREAFGPDAPQSVTQTLFTVALTEVIVGFILSSVFAVILLALLSRKDYRSKLS